MNSKKRLNISDYFKKRNVKRFSIFVAIAFIFLIFSKLSNDYKQTITLNIDLVNLEDEVILQNDSLNTIEAIVEAKGFALLPFVFRNTKTIVFDAKTDIVTKPEHYILDVQKHKYLIEAQFGSSYKVLSVKSDTLLIVYSKRASKYVPVVLKTDIEFGVGFDIKGGFALNVDSIKVVGPSDKIRELNSISTEELSLSNVNTSIKEKINLEEISGVEVFPKSITVSAEVKRFTEGTKEVPITLTNKPANTTINYFPKSVVVSYYVDLDNYNLIKASDFTVECDYSTIENNQAYLIPKITKKPEFIKRISIKQKRIDFIKL